MSVYYWDKTADWIMDTLGRVTNKMEAKETSCNLLLSTMIISETSRPLLVPILLKTSHRLEIYNEPREMNVFL